jgi:hypothetical protein
LDRSVSYEHSFYRGGSRPDTNFSGGWASGARTRMRHQRTARLRSSEMSLELCCPSCIDIGMICRANRGLQPRKWCTL